MATKKVTFEFVFEYDTDNFEDMSDDDYEKMAFETLSSNLHDLGFGEVETIEEN